jgi:hypothetical protein
MLVASVDVRLSGQSGRGPDVLECLLMTDSVEKVSKMKLWN